LVAELRAVAFVQDLIAEGKLKPGEDRRRGVRIHVIEADEWLGGQSLHSKFDTEWSYLNELKQHGRTAADTWLENCLPKVGKASCVAVKARFLSPTKPAARRRRSLIASPRPWAGMDDTAIPAGLARSASRNRRNRLAAASRMSPLGLRLQRGSPTPAPKPSRISPSLAPSASMRTGASGA